ncbi:ATP/GTP-binding protein [Leucobacter allii]|uniref:ATP/GTP-binding protein n=1 Tax=Leucobacter allii TaxID=2932247 RepID=A0ABY4FIC1_9MICO|nr:ATP/GTP-binding protein [Leucobacter allii]UOQ55773.1 ATP/GTP-binding protein [Leucobacter allii]
MARSRRPNKYQRAALTPQSDVTRLAYGGARRVARRGAEWFVRDIPAHRAEKAYRCPECGTEIPQGQAHVVAWSAEHFFGDEAAVRDRRHYHAHCWRLA